MTRRAVPISIKILSTLAAAGVVALSVLTARAAEQKTTRESPLAERGIETLLALKDGKTDEKRTPAQEIELRRKAVLEAIKLSLREIEGLEGKLETLPLPQRAEAELKEAALTTEKRNRSPEEVMRDAHLDSLKSARVLYEAASDTAQKARSLDEIKTIAREIQTYRKAAYNDKLQGIIDFILLSQTRHLIEVTSARWEKIAGDLEKLTRLVAANRERLERDMARARSHIGEARELSERAAELIL
ncbi:MAG: hypothetical protein HY536_00215, partial [Candidatus Colwellbacteria bacterium]|nr:hypothetical protein [Candidatus Colwellbacteria bacterium]